MPLREEFETAGNWLFRRRGSLPLLLLVVALGSLHGFHYPANSHRLDLLWEGACFLLGILGLGIRVATVGFVPGGTSGRQTGGQAAASLNTTGMYSVVRHPLYLGNYLMWLSVALLPRVWWLPVIVSLAFWLYYERIMFAEEEFLRRRTPAFVPRGRSCSRPSTTFSLRAVLRREHSSLLSLVGSFTAVEVGSDLASRGRLVLDPWWAAASGAIGALCVLLYLAKHRTQLLHEKGR